MKEIFIKQLELLLENETDEVVIMANSAAAINEELEDVNWVGFYRYVNNELLLGPFQGKVACVHIPIGKGVCGTAVKEKRTLKVDNVHEFKSHIACDSASNSEVVIPLFKNDKCLGVLDIDSPSFNRFSNDEVLLLEKCAQIILNKL